ncbi:TetR/AcrR family transcriptional regulator [Planctobacterium marinum]|uniref:TetR family transcriptional regulator n=1 Tax=Planctobacterium marinum TaxID=1631968 RepID=A0AA48HGE8_9ALTE|nr:TetR family transcriptional regulator [Planctobacterium marinum]
MRGRPLDTKKSEQQKEHLINAAHQLLAEKSFKNITIREIAARAAVNSAMISYHFGGKEQLFIALVSKLASHNLGQMNTVFSSDNPIKTLIQHMLGFVNKNRAVARFIHDEVLTQDSPLRDQFIKSVPTRIASVLPKLIKKMQQEGKIRADLNPTWAGFSLVSLVMMPFIVSPVREQAWGISEQQISSPEWAEHLYQLFISGCKRDS